MTRPAARRPEDPAVMGMCGVGESLGPRGVAEIGGIRRFAGKRSLAAFAGADPVPGQSGMKKSRSNRSSKRGSPDLRKTLFHVISVLLVVPSSDPAHPYPFILRRQPDRSSMHSMILRTNRSCIKGAG